MSGSLKIAGFFIILSSVLLFTRCIYEIDTSFVLDDELSIRDYIKENKDKFSVFLRIIEESGLSPAYNTYNPNGNNYTLFLPTDDAFQEYLASSGKYNSIDDLLNDTEFVKLLGLFHLVNTEFTTNEFTNGALRDSTMTGDYLTVQFKVENNTNIIYEVNNVAEIIESNIESINGIIHVINRVLQPVNFSSYEWLKEQAGFVIFTELLEQTGMVGQMGVTRLNDNGLTVKNRFTIFAEPDSVFSKRGIQSFNDLALKYGSFSTAFSDTSNSLYKFAAYHLLDNTYFLEQLSAGILNTFAEFPISIAVGIDIEINKGFKNIEIIVDGTDTSFLDYVPIIYDLSNNSTLNGPVHVISEILELFSPPRSNYYYYFYNEPIINSLQNIPGQYQFEKPEKMEVFDWGGAKDGLWYIKSSSASERAHNQDYLNIEGNFWLEYRTPKMRQGMYNVRITGGANNSRYAVIQLVVDGMRLGYPINLRSIGTSAYASVTFGPIEFLGNTAHTVRIETVIPGIFNWDTVVFLPV